ncbi:MAG: hypothetical protein QNJ15_04450 [Erythrobacter sp.]|nr:hypothetical protein [Erythrobacter sp.]
MVAAALGLAAPVVAQDAPEWRPVDVGTGQIRDVEGLEALATAYPESGSVRLRLLQAQLGAGNMPAVLAILEWLRDRGYVFSEGAQAQIPQLVGEEYADEARALLILRPEVIEASEVVAEVPAEAGLVESVVAPEVGTTILVTSVSENAAWTRYPNRHWYKIEVPEMNDLSGMARAPDGSAGWIASSNIDGSEEEAEHFSGLIGVDAEAEITLVPAPDGASISEISVAPDGTVFASDPINGGIYRKPVGRDVLETLIAPGTFRSAQGTAVNEDGSMLYVSDYRYGLAYVDLETREVSRLAADVPVILDGTDGLWLHDAELIAIQNGTSPMRISAFSLSGDGTRITAARILEQAHSGWTEPLGGSIADDALIYVATGQWDRYEKGELREGMEAIPTDIRRLPLK